MSSLSISIADYDNGLRCLLDLLVLCEEVDHLTHEPWDDFSVQSSLLRFYKHASISQFVEGLLSKSSKSLLGKLASIQFHVSSSALFFASLVLDLAAGYFFFATLFSGLVTLGNDQFCIDSFFVFLLLAADDLQLCLFEDFHASLLKSLAAEDVE